MDKHVNDGSASTAIITVAAFIYQGKTQKLKAKSYWFVHQSVPRRCVALFLHKLYILLRNNIKDFCSKPCSLEAGRRWGRRKAETGRKQRGMHQGEQTRVKKMARREKMMFHCQRYFVRTNIKTDRRSASTSACWLICQESLSLFKKLLHICV